MANAHPVVLCHGLFGWGPSEVGGFPYWGTALNVPSPLARYAASVGPISSVHDRACELAFQIKGGRVDYGAAHARTAGHQRFGRTYTGRAVLYKKWSERHPVHLVGHSMGAPTIFMLQHLLATDFFGWGSNANWVKSITAISGVLNGSTATYFLGCDEQTGLIAKGSTAAFLARTIELYIRLTGDLFDRFYDFDLDQWGLSAQPGVPLDVQLQRIAASPMFSGKDNAAYSLTIQGLLAQNALCQTHPETFYFSSVTDQTFRGVLSGHYYPEPGMNPFAIPTSLYIGHTTFPRPFYPGFRSEDWWENDGLVSVYSQMFPRIAGTHPVGGEIGAQSRFDPGKWYHEILSDVDHIDIVALPELGQIGFQMRFYTNLFTRLAAL